MGFLDSTATQTNAPWKPIQPYIKAGAAQASKLLNAGAGFKAPNFQTWAPMSAQTKGALSGIQNLAQAPNALAGQSTGAISGILSGDTNQKYNDLYANSDNAHFATAVQNQSDQIGNDVQRQFSGLGRVGSAADSGALVDQIGRFREQALSDNWNQNIANQRGILGDQTQGQLSAVAAAPGAYQQQYAPYQMQAQVGSAYDDLATRRIQAQLDKYNTNNQAGWNRLGAYQGALSGGGGNPNFASKTVTQPFDWAAAAGSAIKAATGIASL